MSQQINLYNPALRPRREVFSARNVAVATLVSVVAVAALGSIGSSRLAVRKAEAKQAADQLKAAQGRIAELSQRLKNAQPDPVLQRELDRLKQQADGREAVLALMEKGLREPGRGYSDILSGLARQNLSGLWLTGIEVTNDGRALELRGRAVDRALVSEYLRRLNSESVFVGRSFAGLRIELPKAETAATSSASSAPPSAATPASGALTVPMATAASGGGKEAARPPAYLEFTLSANTTGATAKPGDEKADAGNAAAQAERDKEKKS